jgi:hypothetical protein
MTFIRDLISLKRVSGAFGLGRGTCEASYLNHKLRNILELESHKQNNFFYSVKYCLEEW